MDKLAIAQAYNDLPVLGSHSDQLAFRELARISKQAATLVRRFTIVTQLTEISEPYPSSVAMFADIDKSQFRVSDMNHDHPIWTPEENMDFRIFHDVFGHYAAKSGFSWNGELAAYTIARSWMGHFPYRALFTEIVGQTAYYSVHGEFPIQKAALLPEKLMV